MTERVTSDVQRRHTPRIPIEHSRHDRLLVTRFAADDAYPDELENARATVEACAECAALAADIRQLARATASLPAARRTRDFRLNREQAESLRGSRFERLLRRVAAPGLAPLRPVAGVALSLGLVLAVVGAAMPQFAQPAMPASAPAAPEVAPEPGAPAEDRSAVHEFAETPVPQGGHYGGGVQGSHDGAEGFRPLQVDSLERAAQSEGLAVDPRDSTYGVTSTQSPTDAARAILLYSGLAIALVSVAVLLAVWFARRRTHDPLLR